MSHSVYRGFLTEEEKFLKQLERNFKDQINRLKVEELSLLKLISSSGNTTELNNQANITDDTPLFQVFNAENEGEESDDEDMPLAKLSKKNLSPANTDITEANDTESCDFTKMELSVNSVPLNLDISGNTKSFMFQTKRDQEQWTANENQEEENEDDEEDEEEDDETKEEEKP